MEHIYIYMYVCVCLYGTHTHGIMPPNRVVYVPKETNIKLPLLKYTDTYSPSSSPPMAVHSFILFHLSAVWLGPAS